MTTEEATDIAMHVHRNAVEIMANGCELGEKEIAALHAMYDAEIRYTDECVGRLYDHIQELDREVVFVVTADHGELFCEHGLLAHRLVVTDPVTHVPLVVDGLDGVAGAADDIVQHLDISTTLVAQVGGKTRTMQGIDLRTETRDGAISQRGPTEFDSYLNYNPSFDTSQFPSGWLTSYRTRDFRFEYSEDHSALFKPPDEETDVSGNYPDLVAEFEATVTDWLETEGQTVEGGEESNLTDEMRDQLRNLGYME